MAQYSIGFQLTNIENMDKQKRKINAWGYNVDALLKINNINRSNGLLWKNNGILRGYIAFDCNKKWFLELDAYVHMENNVT